MKDNMDILLGNALKPCISPSVEINEEILNMSTRKSEHRIMSTAFRLAKVAAVFIAIISMSSVVVYAANKIIKEVFVTDHAISVGNSDYVDDAAIAEDEGEVDIQKTGHEDGDDSVNWISKDVEVVNGYATNTYYKYKDYATAIMDAGLDNWFNTTYKDVVSVEYVLSETSDFTEKSVCVRYYYNDGSFFVSENIMTGNVASDVAHSIKLKNTNNKREYTATSGNEYTLIDEITEEDSRTIITTFVMIAYDEYYGYISFENLSDEEIQSILDTVMIEYRD